MKNAMDKYALYQTEDFLHDESFVEWVLNPEAKSHHSWTAWIKANPAKKETVQQAINIIRSFNFKQEPVPAGFYTELKNRIDTTINAEEEKEEQLLFNSAPLRKKIWRAAAIVSGLLIGGALIYFLLRPSRTAITTPYAAIRTVVLPDSSEVILNAHSGIRFYADWKTHARKVWVDGEAFFKVHPANNNAAPFTVYTSEAAIEVLGTEFNVKSIDNSTGVMLRSGKVNFRIPGKHPSTVMRPADYCYYNSTTGGVITRTVNPAMYTSWMEHKYRFQETPAREICQTLKEYFGYDFIIRRQSLAEQRISGTLELQDERLLMNVLSELLGATVTRKGEKVIIE
jgi:ferric-dicitrate binding protein FerR (iron transport regulator)